MINLKLPRRRFLQLASGAAVLPVVSRGASAQSYPSRPVRLIVGFAPGGPADVVARQIGPWLSERLGQPLIIENRPGAGTTLATEAVVRAPADGYTLLSLGTSQTVSGALYDKLSFDFIRDIAPVASIGFSDAIMEVHPAFPVKTLPEFIAYAKTNPGKINMASAGSGSPPHMFGELFKMMAGVDLTHVPYRGAAPALSDLLGGQVQVLFSGVPASIEFIRTGRLRALAVTSATRSEELPDVPTVSEFVPGYEARNLYGIGAPKNTPAEIINRLNKEINAGLADPKLKARLRDFGVTTIAGSPADLGKLIADETEKWGKVVKFAGIKPG